MNFHGDGTAVISEFNSHSTCNFNKINFFASFKCNNSATEIIGFPNRT